MVLNVAIIDRLKGKSGLLLDKAKDFDLLAADVLKQTRRVIGVTTLKRLTGYIEDDHNTNRYTLNTIALYLGCTDWDSLLGETPIDSDWNFADDSVYIHTLELGTTIEIKYLNRRVLFEVVMYEAVKALKVIVVENSSLKVGDILIVHKISKGQMLEAENVIRDKAIGNFRTNGEISAINIISNND